MEPIINFDDPIGKTVGRRKMPGNALVAALALNKRMHELHRALGHKAVPQGVFRFKTHAEADEWWMKHYLTRTAK